ncbi:MAG: serine protease [Planctomycetota bacterium]
MLFALLLATRALAAEEDLSRAARSVVEQYGDAVVPLKVVLSVQIKGRDQEQKYEALGTVLDESGLIVASNTAVDPFSRQSKVNSEVKSVKLLRKDGTERKLKIVLRDKELDLMFLQPEEDVELTGLGVAAAGPTLELADRAIVLSRLGPVGDRQPAVLVGRVEAVVTKPRRLYVTATVGSMSALGCPVFTRGGKPVGILTMRVSKAAGAGRIGGKLRANTLPAVLPIIDLLDDIKQAKGEE